MNEQTFLSWLKATLKEWTFTLIAEYVKSPRGPNPWHRHGTITADYTTGLPKIRFDGEDAASGKRYPHLSSYTPLANDRVFLTRSGSTWLVVGKITTA